MPGERRLKYSPFRDVAGMIWSLHYAAWSIPLKTLRPDETEILEPWVIFWCRYVSQAFLEGYLETAGGTAGFVPEKQEDYKLLINTYLIERAVSKMGYILNQRPKRVNIAFRVLKSILEEVRETGI